MTTQFEHEYEFGETVYLRMAQDRRPGMVTQMAIDAKGLAFYTVSWGNATDSRHYEMELTREYVPDFTGD